MIAAFAVRLLLAIFCLVIYWLWRRWKGFQLRDKLGLKGPPYTFWLGSLPWYNKSFNSMKPNDRYRRDLEWTQKYGKVYGMYVGPRLQIVVSDTDIAREIFVKQFRKFSSRTVLGLFKCTDLRHSLAHVTYADGWKKVRSSISPVFTTAKLKILHNTVELVIDKFMKNMEVHAINEDVFDIYWDLQALTLDVIAKCAFGIDSSALTNHKDPFLLNSMNVFRQFDMVQNWLALASFILPELDPIWKWFYPGSAMNLSEKVLVDGLHKVYEKRKQTGEVLDSPDVMQLLMEGGMLDGERYIPQSYVIDNCYFFLLAGYETTSTSLGFCVWLLAKHEDVQERLYKEVENLKNKTNGALLMEEVMKQPYLDIVMKETLRLCTPVFAFTTRECLEETTIKDIRFPKGVWVLLPLYTLHHNPDIWNDSEKFLPERFNELTVEQERAYAPFGIGPRNCLGMRFAEMEFKMTIARLISDYKILLAPGSQDLLELTSQTVICRPFAEVAVKAVKRHCL